MIRVYSILITFFLLQASFTEAQENENVLTEQQLFWLVRSFHPVALQSNLIIDQGNQTVTRSKGAFDPYLSGTFDQKNYDGKNYYQLFSGGLKVPIWYGVELKTGYERNRGVFLNPENNLPEDGLWYAGISVPVGQGLFIDQRRATLKQAKLFAQSTFSEQRKMLNDLYYDAIKAYWKWVQKWNQYEIYNASYDLAVLRHNAVKQSFLLGDKPAIDTLEAYIQVQNRDLARQESFLAYKNQTLELSNFLWYEKQTPLLITDSIHPPKLDIQSINVASPLSQDSLQSLLIQMHQSHPEIQLIEYQLSHMSIEKRMKIEALKPTINLNYNALSPSINSEAMTGYNGQNYKWGMDVSFPIFLRKQRGELQLTQLKINQTEMKKRQKLLEVQNKVKRYYNEQIGLESQIQSYGKAVQNYQQFLIGEQRKFDAGESSLFMINSRENSLIKAQMKYIELQTKYKTAQSGVSWAAGQLYIP